VVRGEVFVVDVEATPRFQTDALPNSKGEFPQDLDAEKLFAFGIVLNPFGFFAVGSPDFGQEGTADVVVLIEKGIEMGGEIPDGEGSLANLFVHEAAETEATGMILHPSGLEGGILAVVGKDQQAFALGVVEHTLGQHMHISSGGGADGTNGFAVLPEGLIAMGFASDARGEGCRLFEAQHQEFGEGSDAATVPTAVLEGGMQGATMTAEINLMGVFGGGEGCLL